MYKVYAQKRMLFKMQDKIIQLNCIIKNGHVKKRPCNNRIVVSSNQKIIYTHTYIHVHINVSHNSRTKRK